jgi:hypothetical protein
MLNRGLYLSPDSGFEYLWWWLCFWSCGSATETSQPQRQNPVIAQPLLSYFFNTHTNQSSNVFLLPPKRLYTAWLHTLLPDIVMDFSNHDLGQQRASGVRLNTSSPLNKFSTLATGNTEPVGSKRGRGDSGDISQNELQAAGLYPLPLVDLLRPQKVMLFPLAGLKYEQDELFCCLTLVLLT